MSRYPSDTRPEAEAVLIDLLRQAPPWRKIRMMEQLNQQMRAFRYSSRLRPLTTTLIVCEALPLP